MRVFLLHALQEPVEELKKRKDKSAESKGSLERSRRWPFIRRESGMKTKKKEEKEAAEEREGLRTRTTTTSSSSKRMSAGRACEEGQAEEVRGREQAERKKKSLGFQLARLLLMFLISDDEEEEKFLGRDLSVQEHRRPPQLTSIDMGAEKETKA